MWACGFHWKSRAGFGFADPLGFYGESAGSQWVSNCECEYSDTSPGGFQWKIAHDSFDFAQAFMAGACGFHLHPIRNEPRFSCKEAEGACV